MSRVFNFSAGPAILPETVLQRAKDEMLDWHGSGMSVMEMSHRGKEFQSIIDQAEADFRELLNIPANYKVLFLQGGGTLQFAMVPINLMGARKKADYIVTGAWSEKAVSEARRFGAVHIAASTKAEKYTHAPSQAELDLSPDAAYVHLCTNETIHGVEFFGVPQTGDIPLVADMSSHLLSRPMDVSQYGLIYAGAQKNVGPVGLTAVIVREDLIGHVLPGMPLMLDYATHAHHGSMYNTPPTYAIYIAGLVFQWLKDLGGLTAMEKINVAKAKVIYDAIDNSGFYVNPVAKPDRSRMNIPFTLPDAALDAEFLAGAKERGIQQIKGHKSVGGMRASIYNAMPMAGCQALADYMTEFARIRG